MRCTLGLVRWLKLVVYLGLAYVVLALSLPRAAVWARLVLGPAGWLPDPPNPLLWVPLVVLTCVFMTALVADVGFGAWKVPASLNGLLLAAFGAAIVGFQAEERGRLRWSAQAFSAPPAARLSRALEEMREDLADHYKEHRAFPTTMEALEATLAGREASGPAPYVYRWLRRRPLALRLHDDAEGPVLEIDDGVLPGTVFYAVSADGQAYWVTVVAGQGVPARPELLAGAHGRPFVQSNLAPGMPK